MPENPKIYFQEYKHDDGIMLVYSNESKNKVLDCKIAYDLKGLKLVDYEGTKIVNVILRPGENWPI